MAVSAWTEAERVQHRVVLRCRRRRSDGGRHVRGSGHGGGAVVVVVLHLFIRRVCESVRVDLAREQACRSLRVAHDGEVVWAGVDVVPGVGAAVEARASSVAAVAVHQVDGTVHNTMI